MGDSCKFSLPLILRQIKTHLIAIRYCYLTKVWYVTWQPLKCLQIQITIATEIQTKEGD